MKTATIWLALRMMFVSFYTPIGFALIPAIVFMPIGVWGYFIGGCSDLNTCYIDPLLKVYSDQKFFRLLMLFWVIGVVIVCTLTYQNFKPEIQENTDSTWRWLITLGNLRRSYIKSFFRAWMRALRPKRKPIDRPR